jgi:hypothetical protein
MTDDRMAKADIIIDKLETMREKHPDMFTDEMNAMHDEVFSQIASIKYGKAPTPEFTTAPTSSTFAVQNTPKTQEPETPKDYEKLGDFQDAYRAPQSQGDNLTIAPSDNTFALPSTFKESDRFDKETIASEQQFLGIDDEPGASERLESMIEEMRKHSDPFAKQFVKDYEEYQNKQLNTFYGNNVGDVWTRGLKNLGQRAARSIPAVEETAVTMIGLALDSRMTGGRLSNLLTKDYEAISEDFSQYLYDKADNIYAEPATGKYAEEADWDEILTDPGRLYMLMAEEAPSTAFLAGTTMMNPAFGTVMMYGFESGSMRDGIMEYEKRTGNEVNPALKKILPIVGGAASAALERVGMKGLIQNLKGKTAKEFRSKYINMVLSGVQANPQLAQTRGFQVAYNSAKEGFTESQQEFVNYLVELGYKPEEAELTTNQLMQSFIVGTGFGMVFGGMGEVMNKAKSSRYMEAGEKPLQFQIDEQVLPKTEKKWYGEVESDAIPDFRKSEDAMEYGRRARGDQRAVKKLQDEAKAVKEEIDGTDDPGAKIAIGFKQQLINEALTEAEKSDIEMTKAENLDLERKLSGISKKTENGPVGSENYQKTINGLNSVLDKFAKGEYVGDLEADVRKIGLNDKDIDKLESDYQEGMDKGMTDEAARKFAIANVMDNYAGKFESIKPGPEAFENESEVDALLSKKTGIVKSLEVEVDGDPVTVERDISDEYKELKNERDNLKKLLDCLDSK